VERKTGWGNDGKKGKEKARQRLLSGFATPGRYVRSQP